MKVKSDDVESNIAKEPGMLGPGSRQIGNGQTGDGKIEHHQSQFSSVQSLSRVQLFVTP